MNEIQKVLDQFMNRNIINIQFIPFNKKNKRSKGPSNWDKWIWYEAECMGIVVLQEYLKS